MLYIIGTGLAGLDSASAEALAAIKESDAVYVEEFTSPAAPGLAEKIGAISGRTAVQAKRWMVEDGSAILDAAKGGTACLVCPGDPYAATTHAELRVRAESEGIRTKTIYGASALSAVLGECGLHQYKSGRTATVMRGGDPAPYRTVLGNLGQKSHTILLLEYSQDDSFFMDPGSALQSLLDAEAGQRSGAISAETYAIVASRIGAAAQKVTAGRISSLLGAGFGDPPHAVIIPGPLHFTEEDALRALACCLDDPPKDDGALCGAAASMIERYAPAVLGAAEQAGKEAVAVAHAEEIIDNAKRYVQDARWFLENGQPEIAVLCIGYADGLADSLRIASGKDPAGMPQKDG